MSKTFCHWSLGFDWLLVIGIWSFHRIERSEMRVGDGVLFAERSNELLRVALSKSFGMET